MKEDPDQFPVPKAVIEPFESLEFLDDLVGHPPPSAYRDDLERRREQAQHALRLKAALEGADRSAAILIAVVSRGPSAGNARVWAMMRNACAKFRSVSGARPTAARVAR
jgi:hypothetical protein